MTLLSAFSGAMKRRLTNDPLDESDPIVGPEIGRVNSVIENSRHLSEGLPLTRIRQLVKRNIHTLELVIKDLDAKRHGADSEWSKARIREVTVAANARLAILERRQKALEDAVTELPSLNFTKSYVVK